jgi:RNA polymerase sigma-70 factor (ECF subfamily)
MVQSEHFRRDNGSGFEPLMKSSYAPAAGSPRWAAHQQPLSKETEELLVDRILRGRIDAFGDLVQPHLTFLSRFAQQRLRSESEAEDVVQQSIFLAFRHLRQFRGEASFKTWLRAIALNEVLRLLNRRTVAPLPLHESFAAGLPDPASSPHIQCEQRERAEQLHKALTRLPEKYRLMIQLRDLRELSIDETARSLSLTSSAVRTRHHRARKLLVRSLAALHRKDLTRTVSAASARTRLKCLQTVNADNP